MINKEDLLELMRVRHSGRSYDPDKVVHQEEINMLIEAARLSPSCFGDEPWRYIICNKQSNQNSWKDLLGCLNKFNRVWVKNAQILIISSNAKKFRFISLSDNILGLSIKGINPWSGHDTGAANYALMLQATVMGLMAHQIGGFDRDRIVERFNISDDFDVMSVIAVGYEEEGAEIKEKKRRPIEEIFFYDEWPRS